ncbi:HNH endonuclease [Bacillus circulans]|uniref:HNH endonuclease n=1 Tax=Niallia circulans TaxID=1397 RepID=UPI00155F9514|nr:HNH endonuclease [Niallia circulans]NRG29171.1 HNH endonuclease [Niallia circulans]
MIKKCSKCKETKFIKEFSRDRSKKDGLTSACRECNNNREKKRRENGGDFTKEQKLAAFKRYGHICQICGNKTNLQVDHKLPQNICEPNKSSIKENAWVLCKSCNIAKADRILLEVIAEVPPTVLEPMLLKECADTIVQKRFEQLPVIIGKQKYTEVKLLC